MKKRKIIIDCDPGIDDSLALMLAAKSDQLDLLGVTIAAGNVDNKQCTQNALDVLHLMGRDDVDVYTGSKKPLKRKSENARDTHGENGVGDYQLEKSPKESKEGAVEFMKDTLLNEDNVSIVALGPLTNIANLVTEYPEVIPKIDELMIMGGVYQDSGNCSPVAEFNIWFDPDAAKIVFDKLDNITMTGLDVTRKALLTPNYQALIGHFNGDVAKAITGMSKFYTDFHWNREGSLGCVINDPLAVAQFIDPTICSGINAHVDIITDGEAVGMTMVDSMGITGKNENCLVLTECDSKAFFKLFLKTLFKEESETIDRILDDSTYGS